jgi:ubiquinone/menaquinone biosynthesis C-methylase UbiE
MHLSSKGDEETRAYYDDFSHGYERGRDRGYHALVDELEISAVEDLARDASVLEVGCGTGLMLDRLSRIARSVHGADLSPGMLEKARERGFDVVVASATELPYEDDRFDLVCSFKVLAHVPEIGKALEEMARVVKPGGHLAVEFYNPWSLRYLAKRAAGPGSISNARTEADVFTRWDSPLVVRRILPPGVELVDFRGVRIVTPAASIHRVPVVGSLVGAVERSLVRSRLRYFGGFLIAIARKSAS